MPFVLDKGLAHSRFLKATRCFTALFSVVLIAAHAQALTLETQEMAPTKLWQQGFTALREAYARAHHIPAFFFAHGSPLLIYPQNLPSGFPSLHEVGGPNGLNAQFLKDFGPFLLDTYKPKAIVIFSAHWETSGGLHVMDTVDHHLYYDYYGFPKELYEVKFPCKGSSTVATRVLELFEKHNIPSKRVDGKRGLDHGNFVPFLLMFPNGSLGDTPVVPVSIDSGMDPAYHVHIGQALEALGNEGILVLSGGLTIHTFEEMEAWDPKKANKGFKEFENEVKKAITDTQSGNDRNAQLIAVTKHPYYRRAHPRPDHFMPIYVAAGAGSAGSSATLLTDMHSAISAAFGVDITNPNGASLSQDKQQSSKQEL